jgi:hypothetical protein
MSIPPQAITLDATGSVLRYGYTTLIAGTGETLHIMTNLDPPNTDNSVFWKVESGLFVAMTAPEKLAAIAWYKTTNVYNIGNAGTTLNIDWINGSIQKVVADELSTDITITKTEPCASGCLPIIRPEIHILLVNNSGGTKTFNWPSNIYWNNGAPNITTGLNIFKFDRYLDNYLGERFRDGS